MHGLTETDLNFIIVSMIIVFILVIISFFINPNKN